MSLQAALYFNRKRRKDRQASVLFSSLSANLGTTAVSTQFPTGLVLPHYSLIGVSFNLPITAGQIEVETSRGDVITVDSFPANFVEQVGFFEKNVELFFSSQIAGSLVVHRIDGIGRNFPIASGSFT